MAKCNACSAPLLANINRCRYCNVRNDIDLHANQYSIKTPQTERICPHCDTRLQTVKLNIDGAFYIERCKTCFGLFFDPGEIETLLQSSVSNVFDINLKLIKNINKDRYQRNKTVKYVKCPICRILMNRVNFGRRSGVIIDRCSKHGVWVDSGEITHLMEWKKAGGELLNKQHKKSSQQKKKSPHSVPSNSRNNEPLSYTTDDSVLFDNISSLVWKLFS